MSYHYRGAHHAFWEDVRDASLQNYGWMHTKKAREKIGEFFEDVGEAFQQAGQKASGAFYDTLNFFTPKSEYSFKVDARQVDPRDYPDGKMTIRNSDGTYTVIRLSEGHPFESSERRGAYYNRHGFPSNWKQMTSEYEELDKNILDLPWMVQWRKMRALNLAWINSEKNADLLAYQWLYAKTELETLREIQTVVNNYDSVTQLIKKLTGGSSELLTKLLSFQTSQMRKGVAADIAHYQKVKRAIETKWTGMSQTLPQYVSSMKQRFQDGNYEIPSTDSWFTKIEWV